MLPKVFLIVLCYNGIDLTLECLASLRQQDYPAAKILVVDNASRDGTAATIGKEYPEVEVITTGDNLGYAGGNNVGIRAALERDADAIFLINNDTWLEPNCVSTLIDTVAAHPRVGIIGPMVYDGGPGRVISSAGGRIDWAHADAMNVGAGDADQGQYLARNVDFINGCGIMATSSAVKRAGLLDPRYFMYWEETDWCQRVSQAGFDVCFEPAARMRHKATRRVLDLGPTTLYYVSRNRLLFFAEHTPVAQRTATLVRAVHGLVRGIIQHRRAGRYAQARATQAAVWHALIGRWGRYDRSRWSTNSAAQPAPKSISPHGAG